jgi:hypothetical protein
MLKTLLAVALVVFIMPVKAETYLACSYDKKAKSIQKLLKGKAKIKIKKINARKNTPESFKRKYLLLTLNDTQNPGEKSVCQVSLGKQVNEIKELNWDCDAFSTTDNSYYRLIKEQQASGDAYLSRTEGRGKTESTLQIKHFEELERDSLIFLSSDKKFIYTDYTDAEIARRTKPTGTWSLDFSNKMIYRDRKDWVGPEEKWFCSISDLATINKIKDQYNALTVPFLVFQQKEQLEAQSRVEKNKAEQTKANKI